jgi:hypothetical protein
VTMQIHSKFVIAAGIVLLGTVSNFLLAQERPAPTVPNPPLFKGEKPKKDDNTRMVAGVVRDANDNAAEGAIVKLKDMKSLAIRSFLTKADGTYSFQGLSNGIDYELRAEREGVNSPVKILTVFDNRRQAVINLKLEAKK